MPTTITAAVSRVFTEPLLIEELTLADPGPGEVRVRIEAVAVCHSDIHLADGAWGGPLPAVWGHEAVGTVVESGDLGVSVGDRVVVTLIRSCGECRHCQAGATVACLSSFPLDAASPLTDADGVSVRHGVGTAAFAEQVVVHASQVVVIDRDIPVASASLLACGVITGVGAVINTARVRAGSSVVVIGCGGVGVNVLQGAVLAGATTIVAVDMQPSKLDFARSLGATHVADPSTDDVKAIVADATGGDLADYVFVATGAAPAHESALRLVGAMGALVVVGLPEASVKSTYSPIGLASANQRILGSLMGTTVIARDIPTLVQQYRDGVLELDGLISNTFPLADINRAIDEVRDGSALRNVIVFDTP